MLYNVSYERAVWGKYWVADFYAIVGLFAVDIMICQLYNKCQKDDVYSVLHVIMVLHIAFMHNWDILKSMVIFVVLEIKYVFKHAFMGSSD